MATETWKVAVSAGVNIRSGPSTSHGKVGALANGTTVTSTERSGAWVKINKGWVCTNSGGKALMSLVSSPSNVTNVPPSPSTGPGKPPSGGSPGSGYQPETWYYKFAEAGSYDQSESTTIRNIMAVFGVPYQFLANADNRLYDRSSAEAKTGAQEDGAAMGRTYANKIVSKMPLFLITPGKPNFMTRFSDKDKKSVISQMTKLVSGDSSASLDKLLTVDGRYYTFQFDHVRYFNFVNPMCRIAAQYLGIGDYYLAGTRLKSFNWGDGSHTNPPAFIRPRLESFLNTGLPGCIAFYLNSDTQISESFSNSTTESMLASKVNSVSDMGRELSFLLGYGSSALALDIDKFKDTDIADNVENVEDFMGGLLGKNNFIKSLAQHFTTVAKGGKLTFPEIWNDSSFTRSYDVSIKLTTPDCDKLSWYLNICVPLLHLIGLVAPQSINANPNGYMSPFLVRAVYKGLFNIETGIITNMSISKGQESGWTKEGLPTVIDISFTIKDLYEAMSITNMQDSTKYDTMNNTALMDYIANLCGINIFKPEIMRNIEMWYVQNVGNRAKDTLFNVFDNLEQNTLNKIMQLYERNRFL